MIINGVKFPSDPEQGYWIKYWNTGHVRSEFGHTFCGPQNIPGAQCSCCQRPLVRYLALDTRDPRLHLLDSPFPMLSLMDCPRCMVEGGSPAHYGALLYRVHRNSVELAPYVLEGWLRWDDSPYKDYPAYFPEAQAVLQPLTAVEQEGLTRINHRCDWENMPPEVLDAMSDEEFDELQSEDWWQEEFYRSLFDIRHQFGGEPFHIQGLQVVNCPECGVQMPFLACIADDCLDIRGIVGDETNARLFHYCRRCHVVGTYSLCG